MGLFLATSDEHGDLVTPNATNLSAAVAAAATTINVLDAVFSNEDVFILGEEEITVISGGDTTELTVAAISSAHIDRATCRLDGGHQLLTKTFSGSESLSCIRFGGEREAHFLVIEQVGSTYFYYHEITAPHKLAGIIAAVRHKPASGTVYTIKVWPWAEAVFFAEIQS